MFTPSTSIFKKELLTTNIVPNSGQHDGHHLECCYSSLAVRLMLVFETSALSPSSLFPLSLSPFSLSCLTLIVNCSSDPAGPNLQTTPNGHTSLGTNVTFSCDFGYNLNGSSSLICLTAGQWNGALPSCDQSMHAWGISPRPPPPPPPIYVCYKYIYVIKYVAYTCRAAHVGINICRVKF